MKLRKRVEQILGYHRVDAGKVKPKEIIAHFTNWGACEGMLSAAQKDRGLTLWAGDANCLNDPLEGGALIKYAEDKADRADRADREYKADKLKSQSDPIGLITQDSTMTWKKLRDILHDLYQPPPPSAVRWNVPRPIPSSQVHLVSFCSDSDRLDLWRAYGDEAKGVCMVMPLASAVDLVKETPSWRFCRVMYGLHEDADIPADGQAMNEPDCLKRAWILLAEPLEEVWRDCRTQVLKEKETARQSILKETARQRILDTLSPVLHLYKHYQFETEREIRLVYYGSNADPEIEEVKGTKRAVLKTKAFFLKGPDCEIVLGPKAPNRNERITYLRVVLRKLFTTNVPEVGISRVPYQ